MILIGLLIVVHEIGYYGLLGVLLEIFIYFVK